MIHMPRRAASVPREEDHSAHRVRKGPGVVEVRPAAASEGGSVAGTSYLTCNPGPISFLQSDVQHKCVFYFIQVVVSRRPCCLKRLRPTITRHRKLSFLNDAFTATTWIGVELQRVGVPNTILLID